MVSGRCSCANEQTRGAWKVINGGEGFCDLRARVLAQRDALLGALEPGAAGVVVSHMWVTRAMVGEALGESDPTKVDVPTASVSVIDYPDGFSAPAFAAGCPGLLPRGGNPMCWAARKH